MPRQNFLSRESFVNANEGVARTALLSIPVFATNISLQSESKTLHNYRFICGHADASSYYIDVSVLPLNEAFTRISLHATHISGASFHHAPEMALALHDFEHAVSVAINGDTSLYQPSSSTPKKQGNLSRTLVSLTAAIGLLFLRKKLS